MDRTRIARMEKQPNILKFHDNRSPNGIIKMIQIRFGMENTGTMVNSVNAM